MSFTHPFTLLFIFSTFPIHSWTRSFHIFIHGLGAYSVSRKCYTLDIQNGKMWAHTSKKLRIKFCGNSKRRANNSSP